MDTGACPDGCDGGWIGERCDTGTSCNILDKMQQIILFCLLKQKNTWSLLLNYLK